MKPAKIERGEAKKPLLQIDRTKPYVKKRKIISTSSDWREVDVKGEPNIVKRREAKKIEVEKYKFVYSYRRVHTPAFAHSPIDRIAPLCLD